MSDHRFTDARGYYVTYNEGQDLICNVDGLTDYDPVLCYPLETQFLDGITQTAHTGLWIKWWLQHDKTDPPIIISQILDEGIGGVADAYQQLVDEVQAVVASVQVVANDVTTLITSLEKAISDAVTGIGTNLTKAFNDAVDLLNSSIASIATDLNTAITGIQQAVVNEVTKIGGFITTAINSIGNDVSDAVTLVGNDVSTAVGAIGLLVTNAVKAIGKDISDLITALETDLSAIVQSVGQDIITAIDHTINLILPPTLGAIQTAEAEIHALLVTLQQAIRTPEDWVTGAAKSLDAKYAVLRDRIADTFKITLPPALKDAIDLLEGDVPPEVVAVFNALGAQHEWPDIVQAMFNAVTTDQHAGGLFTKLIGFGALLEVVMDTVGGPLLRESGYGFELALKSKQPAFRDAIKAYQRGLINYDRFAFLGGIEGYGTDAVNLLGQLATERLSPLEYVSLWRRGLLDEAGLRTNLAAVGIVGDQFGQIKQATEYVPTTTDVLVWLTRDVFIPEFRQRFQMDAEFPTDSLPLFKAIGISEVNARNFWAAHWELPSIEQGYRMYRRLSSDQSLASGEVITLPDGSQRRRIIGSDDLHRLLRAKGVEPFWRAKQVAVSFNTFTRVDLRRMFAAGILSESDVLAGYIAIGYDTEDARRLTAFATSLAASQAQADIAPWKAGLKAKVIASFEGGFLSEEEARAHLEDVGFTDAQIDFYLHESLFTQTVADRKAAINPIKKLYVQGLWSSDRVVAELQGNGVPSTTTEHLLHDWALDKQYRDQEEAIRRHKELTRAEIITAYRERIFNADEASEHLATVGWSPDEIHVLLAEADYQEARATATAVKAATHDLFLEGRLDRTGASARLDALNLGSAQRDALLDSWDVEITRRIPKIPLALLEKMMADGVIAGEDARAELLSQHYTEREATLLLALWGDEIATQQAKERAAAAKAAAQAERERQAAAKAAKVARAPTRVFLTTRQAFDAYADGIITQTDLRINLLLNRIAPFAVEQLMANTLGDKYVPPTQSLEDIDAEVLAAFGENQLTLRDDPLSVQRELRRYFGTT